MEKLNPCPFCGGLLKIVENGYTRDALRMTEYYGKCLDCGVSTLFYDTREKAVAACNRRPSTPVLSQKQSNFLMSRFLLIK